MNALGWVVGAELFVMGLFLGRLWGDAQIQRYKRLYQHMERLLQRSIAQTQLALFLNDSLLGTRNGFPIKSPIQKEDLKK